MSCSIWIVLCHSCLFLSFPPSSPVPTTNVVIYDRHFNSIEQLAGPFDEDANLTLICDSSEGIIRFNCNPLPLFPDTYACCKQGNPLPMVYWWKGQQVIDTDYFIVNGSIARNVLLMSNISRDDLLVSLTCQAYNTNLTVPVSKTITLDLNCKCFPLPFLFLSGCTSGRAWFFRVN